MAVKAQIYTFHCRFQTEARLPGYLGSTLRGALGWSLKKVSCALRRQQCDTCLLREQCAYAWIFETEKYRAGDGRAVNARPHPFVLQPNQNISGSQKRGDNLIFSILLFGRGNDLLPQIIYAVQLMGKSGIGAGRKQGLGRFQLRKVMAGQEQIFSADSALFNRCQSIGQIYLEERPYTEISALQVTLHTPLRLKHGNKLNRELPFNILIRTGLRRIAALEDAYGDGEPELDYKGLVKKAEAVKTITSRIRWQELFRYSNRQAKKVSLSGLSGILTYQGKMAAFIPILHYCQQVHIGKQTVFGLGRISMEKRQV